MPTEAWRGFAHRGGFVSPPDALECLGVVDALGECGDRACGTHRLTKPGVRRTFVDQVCAAYAASPAAATRPLRYASVGAGLFAAPKTKTGERRRVRLNGAFFSRVEAGVVGSRARRAVTDGRPPGLALLDFEILCTLKATHGIVPKAVLLVDPLYGAAFKSDDDGHRDAADDARHPGAPPRTMEPKASFRPRTLF